MQTVVVLLTLGIIYKFGDAYVQKKKPAPAPPNGQKAVEARLRELELHVTNHLTTSVDKLISSITLLTIAIRDMQEQANRVANTSNVILDKIDGMRDKLTRLDGKISP